MFEKRRGAQILARRDPARAQLLIDAIAAVEKAYAYFPSFGNCRRVDAGDVADALRKHVRDVLLNSQLKEIAKRRKSSLNIDNEDAGRMLRDMTRNLPKNEALIRILHQSFNLSDQRPGTSEKLDRKDPKRPQWEPREVPGLNRQGSVGEVLRSKCQKTAGNLRYHVPLPLIGRPFPLSYDKLFAGCVTPVENFASECYDVRLLLRANQNLRALDRR